MFFRTMTRFIFRCVTATTTILSVVALIPSLTFAQGANSARGSNSTSTVRPPDRLKLPGSDLQYSRRIPTNFPLPIYKSNLTKTAFFNSTKGVPMTAVANIVTKDSPKTVFDWYSHECERANWKVIIPSAKLMDLKKTPGEFYMLSAFKNEQTARILFYPGPKNVGTSVNVQWTSKKKPN
jgi:hypothetical protein